MFRGRGARLQYLIAVDLLTDLRDCFPYVSQISFDHVLLGEVDTLIDVCSSSHCHKKWKMVNKLVSKL